MKCAAGIMTRQWGALHLGNKVANISIKPVLTDIWCEMVYYSTLLIVEDIQNKTDVCPDLFSSLLTRKSFVLPGQPQPTNNILSFFTGRALPL